jgi:hypothetical protein
MKYKMKKITILTILMTSLTTVAFGQITTTKVVPKTEKISTKSYDGSKNFLGKDVYKYRGQELYLKGKAKSLRMYGYNDFLLDYTEDSPSNRSNVYKCCDSYNSKYNDLAGKYFKVLDIIKHPKAAQSKYIYGSKFYLKLQEKESEDIVYFKYDSLFEHSFPFIVVGFYERQKKLVVGKEFVFADKVLKSSTDIKTGKTVTTKTGQKWKCTDLTIEEQYFSLSLVIENSSGEITTIPHDSVFGKWSYNRSYTLSEAENHKKKFGHNNFYKILQGKVKIGMTREMCKLSWGKPKRINETITSGKKTEQWIYSDNNLYFDNDILTAIQ